MSKLGFDGLSLYDMVLAYANICQHPIVPHCALILPVGLSKPTIVCVAVSALGTCYFTLCEAKLSVICYRKAP